MRLTIVPVDGFVNVDGNQKFQPFDLSGCGIPDDVHALQWYETRGWIEFRDNDDDPFTPKPANQEIDELPAWANACVQVWEQWTPPPAPEPEPETPVV